MADGQGDLFFGGGSGVDLVANRDAPRPAERAAIAWEALDDAALIGALPGANIAGSLAIASEIGRRKLPEAVSELLRLCERFHGFGLGRIVPEQAAALDALAAIGGGEAAQAVASLIVRGTVQGPALKKAVKAAADLGSALPAATVVALLRDDVFDIRADACRCCAAARSSPEVARALLDLLEDLHADVRKAAACALGRLGRSEARAPLIALLREAPSGEVIDAVAPIADEECIVLLGRLGRQDRRLRAPVLDALDAIDHPRAEKAARAVRKML
jgi:HEAT repeat protein